MAQSVAVENNSFAKSRFSSPPLLSSFLRTSHASSTVVFTPACCCASVPAMRMTPLESKLSPPNRSNLSTIITERFASSGSMAADRPDTPLPTMSTSTSAPKEMAGWPITDDWPAVSFASLLAVNGLSGSFPASQAPRVPLTASTAADRPASLKNARRSMAVDLLEGKSD